MYLRIQHVCVPLGAKELFNEMPESHYCCCHGLMIACNVRQEKAQGGRCYEAGMWMPSAITREKFPLCEVLQDKVVMYWTHNGKYLESPWPQSVWLGIIGWMHASTHMHTWLLCSPEPDGRGCSQDGKRLGGRRVRTGHHRHGWP